MRPHFLRVSFLAVLAALVVLGSLSTPLNRLSAQATKKATALASWAVFASGLNNPRGLAFGLDGVLYVAEGGLGGSKRTTKQDCEQVPDPSGPYSGGMTSRISKIGPDGKRLTVIDGLPSSQTSPRSGSDVSGVSALAFLDDTLYAVTAGAGCSHGLKDSVNALLRITADGKAEQVADLSAFLKANPPKVPDLEDYEPDGDIYSMVQVDGKFYIMEANHGELDEITLDGKIRRIIDISASQGHVVPTALAYHDGSFYVGTLSMFPVVVGSSRIYKITPEGEITMLSPRVTTVLGVAFDKDGQLYVLETSSKNNAYPVPQAGRVVRVNPDSEDVEVIASGLTFPTGMAFGPDGMLYISNFGFNYPAGRGQIVRMAVPPTKE